MPSFASDGARNEACEIDIARSGSAACAGCGAGNLIANGQFASTCASGLLRSSNTGDAVDIPSWLVTNGGNPTDANGSVDLITGYWEAPPGGGNIVDLDGNAFGGVSQSFATVLGQ